MHRPRLPLLLTAIATAAAEVFNLDDSTPWPISNGVPIRWVEGWDALTVAESACIRVNARGVFAKPSHWTPRALDTLGWAPASCQPGGGRALCSSPRGSIFPTASNPVYNTSAQWPGLRCTKETRGRVLDTTQDRYDVSACDVLDAGGDAVVCDQRVWTRRTGVSVWVYWALCLLAVLIVRALSYLVVGRMQPTPDPNSPGQSNALTVVACVATLPLVLIPDGDAVFITSEESFFFWCLCGYVVAYALLFTEHSRHEPGTSKDEQQQGRPATSKDEHQQGRPGTSKDDPPIYNLIAATLQVIACRLYTGTETPYNPMLLWAVLTRMIVKLRADAFTPLMGTTILLDSLLLALMCILGFPYNPIYLIGIACAAITTADAFC